MISENCFSFFNAVQNEQARNTQKTHSTINLHKSSQSSATDKPFKTQSFHVTVYYSMPWRLNPKGAHNRFVPGSSPGGATINNSSTSYLWWRTSRRSPELVEGAKADGAVLISIVHT